MQFVAFGPKQSLYLTHSAREYFEKVAFKKSKKRNFERLYLKNWDEFKFKTNMFWKLIQFSFKQGGLYQAPSIWVHGRGLRPLQRPVRMPAAH